MNKKQKILFKILLTTAIIFVVIFAFYALLFESLSWDTRVDLTTIEVLSPSPYKQQVTLRFSKGWQLRSEYLDVHKEAPPGIIKVKIKNKDNKSMVVSLSLIPNTSMIFNCEECEGFIDILQPSEERIIYEGPISNFVGKVIRIKNKKYLKTSFDISFESKRKINLQNPIRIFAYIPTGTL